MTTGLFFRPGGTSTQHEGVAADVPMPSLFATDEFDLRDALRDGETDDQIAARIAAAVGTKWAGHRINQVNFVRPERSMSQIGG